MLDALIIYLALGAPVAMYHFFQLKRPIHLTNAARIVAVFVLWPLWAIRFILPSRLKLDGNTHFVTRENLDVRIIENVENLKNSVLAILSKGGPSGETLPVMDDLEAYVEYSTVVALETGRSNPEIELLDISGHPDVTVASKCLRRKNRNRLENHRILLGKRLAAMLPSLQMSQSKRRALIDQVRSIALAFDDHDLVSALEAGYGSPVSDPTDSVVYA